jgi:hypothetical protein
VIDAARDAGVAQLAYVGVFGGPKADFLLADEHKETEQLIPDSGLPYTLVHTSLTGAEQKKLFTDAGVPEPFADILVDVDDAISRGALSATPGDLSRLIGRPTTPIADSIAAALA